MTSTGVLGATGMTGSLILSTLLSMSASQVSSIITVTRRPPTNSASSCTGPKLTTHVDKDTSKWESLLSTPAPPQILFSALATTRGAAGGFDKQYALEHDLNVALAKAARSHPTSPTHTYVLISSASGDVDSRLPYLKMKGEIERDVLALDFAHTVILRPGIIAGRREESRPAEAIIRWVADIAGWVSGGKLKDFWAQDADVIARAAVRAGLRAQRGGFDGKSTIIDQKEILEMGRQPLTDEERTGS